MRYLLISLRDQLHQLCRAPGRAVALAVAAAAVVSGCATPGSSTITTFAPAADSARGMLGDAPPGTNSAENPGTSARAWQPTALPQPVTRLGSARGHGAPAEAAAEEQPLGTGGESPAPAERPSPAPYRETVYVPAPPPRPAGGPPPFPALPALPAPALPALPALPAPALPAPQLPAPQLPAPPQIPAAPALPPLPRAEDIYIPLPRF